MGSDLIATTLGRRACASGDLRALRIAAGLSVRDLAVVVGVNPGSVSRWERGINSPRGERAARLGQVVAELRALDRAS